MLATTKLGRAVLGIWPAISLIAIVAAATALVAALAPDTFQTVWAEILIRIVLVIGLYIFIGNSGIFAFGHVSFACIGGYMAAWLTMDPMFKQIMLTGLPLFIQESQWSPMAGVLAATVFAALVALVIGAVIVRLSDIAASIATFAFMIIVNRVYANWDAVTGGVAPLTNIPPFGGLSVTLAFVAIAIVVAFLFQQSRYGLMLKASRDDEVAARAAGVAVYRMRLLAFVISAAVMGCGGALYTFFLGILTVDAFYLSLTFMLLVMLIVGGAESLAGAVIGVVCVSLVAELLRAFERGVQIADGVIVSLPLGTQEIGLGAFMVIILIYRSSGLMRGKEIALPKFLNPYAVKEPAR